MTGSYGFTTSEKRDTYYKLIMNKSETNYIAYWKRIKLIFDKTIIFQNGCL